MNNVITNNHTKKIALKSLRIVSPYLLLCILFWTWGRLSFLLPSVCRIILLSLLMLVSLSLLVLDCYWLFRKNWVKLLVFIACTVWGIWLYDSLDRLSPEQFNIWLRTLNAINNSFSSFFLSRGDYQVHLMPEGIMTHGYILFHFTMYVFVAALTLSLFGRKIINTLNGFTTLLMPTYAFWSKKQNEKVDALCKSILDNTAYEQMVLAFEENSPSAQNALFDQYMSRDIVVSFIDRRRLSLSVRRASQHFFMDSDAHWNLAMANLLLEQLPAKSSRKPKITLRISDDQEDLFQCWAIRAREKADVTLFSEEQMVAQSFTMNHPMLQTPGIEIDKNTCKVSGTFQVLLVGFNRQARELLRAVVIDSQFVGSEFKADIAAETTADYEWFCQLYSEAVREYSLNFKAVSSQSKEFWTEMERKIGEYNRVIICQDDDYANITTAFRYQKLAKEHGKNPKDILYVQVKERLLYPCLATMGDKTMPFTIFGQRKTCYSYQSVFQNKIEKIARLMNHLYYDSYPSSDAAWNAVLFLGQNAQRSAVRGQLNHLRILFGDKNHRPPEHQDKNYKETYKKWSQEFNEKMKGNVLEVLAENDHRRWCALYYLNGIKRLDISTTPLPIKRWKKSQILEFNAHAGLCPYNELPQLDAFLAEKGKAYKTASQEYIRQLIRKIPDFWKE